MPMKIAERKGLFCPVVTCDHCGKEITEAADGNYHWRLEEVSKDVTEDGAAMYFTHKACCYPFERANAGSWGAEPLECLPVFIVNNLKVDWKQAKGLVSTRSLVSI